VPLKTLVCGIVKTTPDGSGRQRAIRRCCLLLLLSLCCANRLAAECKAPAYREVADYRLNTRLTVVSSALTVKNLICLAGLLKARYDRPKMFVYIFNTEEAARRFLVLKSGAEGYSLSYDRALRAIYSLDQSIQEEYLLITPVGWNDGSDEYVTRIDLPVATIPQCRFELHGRCLVTFEGYKYHSDISKSPLSGTVTLTAHVNRLGGMSSIHIVSSDSEFGTNRGELTRAAIDNLREWRVEPAPQQDIVRIKYIFDVRSSPPGNAALHVTLALPDQVLVTDAIDKVSAP